MRRTSGHNDQMYVWMSKDEVFNLKKTLPSVKDGGGRVML